MTSNHEGVSCNLCRKNNFKGLRYKCLVCYDYDLCSACYDAGLTSSRHTIDHPMQCIVARNDYDLFYSGESVSADHPQSLTCPLCGNLGYTETTLLEHVTNEHANSDNEESSAGIVCPICGVETNQLTYDFATHLTMEHRTPRDHIEQVSTRGRGSGSGRCPVRCNGVRGRRPQPHYNPIGGPPGSSPSSSSAIRDSTDPLVEIMAQLSSIRRAGAGAGGPNCGIGSAGGNGPVPSSSNQSHVSQLQQLQMRLQSSPSFSQRTNANSGHQDREVRITRRTFQTINNNSSTSNSIGNLGGSAYATGVGTHYNGSQPFMLMDQSSLSRAGLVSSGGIGGGHSHTTSTSGSGLASSNNGLGLATGSTANQQANGMLSSSDGTNNPQFSTQSLLSSCMKTALCEAEQQQREILKADRSLFVQDLLLQVGLLEKNSK